MAASKRQDQPADDGSPDITVFRGWRDPGKYVWSPYVIKLEARLRLAGVRYRTDAGSPKTAPRGKIPYIEYSAPSSETSGGTRQKALLADSALIIKTLAEWDVVPDLNAALRAEERVKDLGIRALLEDKLIFYHVSLCPLLTGGIHRV